MQETSSVEGTTRRGIDRFGLPSPLLLAVAQALRPAGIAVGVKASPGEEWVGLEDAESFFRLARLRPPSRLHLRVTGPGAAHFCKDLCALVDEGNPACLVRAGFVEVPFRGSLSRVDPLAWDRLREEFATPGAEWVYWRIRPAGTADSTYAATPDLRPAALWGAECWAYCRSEEAARLLQERVNALPSGPAARGQDDLWVVNETGDEAWAWVMAPAPLGMHFRPIVALAHLACRFQAEVRVEDEDQRVANARSPQDLLVIGPLSPGTRFLLRARGSDAGQAIRALVDLIRGGFNADAEFEA